MNSRRPVGSIGLPLPGTLARVADAAGHAVAVGRVGRLQLSGPSIADQGWLDTGVSVRMDSSGFFYLDPPPAQVPAGPA